MIRIYCDRCGKEIKDEEMVNSIKSAFKALEKAIVDTFSEPPRYYVKRYKGGQEIATQICGECESSLAKWWEEADMREGDEE